MTAAGEGTRARGAFAVAAATVLALAAALWAIGDYPGMFGDCDDDPGRLDAMRDWQRLYLVGATIAAPAFLYGVHRWLAAVWPHRDTAWVTWLLGLLSALAIGIGMAIVSGWTVPDELDWLGVPVGIAAILWVWPFLPLGFWPGLVFLVLLTGALVRVAPARRWFHALMLFLVITGWWAVAGVSLAMSEGAFAC